MDPGTSGNGDFIETDGILMGISRVITENDGDFMGMVILMGD